MPSTQTEPFVTTIKFTKLIPNVRFISMTKVAQITMVDVQFA